MPLHFRHPHTPHKKLTIPEWYVSSLMMDRALDAIVRRAIVDKNVTIPEGTKIGVDLDLDRERFVVSPGGIVVIGKGQKVG